MNITNVNHFNNYIDIKRDQSFSEIISKGVFNIQKAFSRAPQSFVFVPQQQAYRSKPLDLAGRIKCVVIGILLVIPLVNLVAFSALMRFATLKGPGLPDHQGAGVLPYCIHKKEVFFLISKEAYGPEQGTWCDFGGARDLGETALQTAVRECWEESRGILGDQNTIQKKILKQEVFMGEYYPMFLMKVNRLEDIDIKGFKHRVFKQFSHMEKNEIAWVKASHVFEAIHNRSNKILVNGSYEILRDCFAQTIANQLKTGNFNQALFSEEKLLSFFTFKSVA